MASPPQAPIISPAEIQILVSRAGLVLNPGQVADLVLAWRQVAGLIGTMHRDRGMADDMALVFRLPPPTEVVPPRARTEDEKPARARSATKPTPRVKQAATTTGRTATKAKPAPRLAPADSPPRKAPTKAKRR